MKRQLKLDRETIVRLGHRQLSGVVAGMEPESGCTACNPNHTKTCSCETACPDQTTNDTQGCKV